MQIISERTSSKLNTCQHKTIPYSHHKKKSIERSSHKKIYRMKFLHLALSSVTGDCVQMIHKCRVKWLCTIKYYQHTHTHTQQRKEGQKPPPKPYTYVYSCVGDSIRRDAGLTSPPDLRGRFGYHTESSVLCFIHTACLESDNIVPWRQIDDLSVKMTI